MNFGTKHPIGLGLFLIIFSGSILALAQSPDTGGVNGGQPAPSNAASQQQGGAGHDSSYIIGNGDLLAISVWKEAELTNRSRCDRTGRFRCHWWARYRRRG